MNTHQLSFIGGLRHFDPKHMASSIADVLGEVFEIEQSPAVVQQFEAQCALLLWGFLAGSAEHNITINARRFGLAVSIMYVCDDIDVRKARIQFDVANAVSHRWDSLGYVREVDIALNEFESPFPLRGEDGWTYKTADDWKRPHSRKIREYNQSLTVKWIPITSTTSFTPEEWEAAWKATSFIRVPDPVLGQYPPRSRRLVSSFTIPESVDFGDTKFGFRQMASELEVAGDHGSFLVFGEAVIDGGASFECVVDAVTETVYVVDPDSPDEKPIYVNVDLETFFRCLLSAVTWEASVDAGSEVSRKDVNALKSSLKDLDATAFRGRNSCFWPIMQPFRPVSFG